MLHQAILQKKKKVSFSRSVITLVLMALFLSVNHINSPISAQAAPDNIALVGVTIGDYVWRDANGNGLQDAGEPGIEGIKLTLHDAAGTPMMCVDPAIIDTYRDELEGTTNNNSDGSLDWTSSWSHTSSSSSIATVGNPGGSLRIWSGTAYHATRPVDLSVFTGTITLSFDHKAASSTTLFNIQYSDDGVSYTTLNSISSSTTYQTSSYTLPNTATHIRFIGVSGAQYSYFDNVTISGTVPQPVTTTSDSSGLYMFDGDNCIDPNTDYQIHIDTDQLPLYGLNLTTQNAGDDTLDSDATAGSKTVFISATSPLTGENMTYDFGFTTIAIGDYVWLDTNNNGVQDGGESGISDVEVTLHDAAGDPILCRVPTVVDTYSDEFNTLNDNNSDGSLLWATIWVRTNVTLTNGQGNPPNSMQLYGNTTYYATREVDLSVFSGPITLSFDHVAPSGSPVVDTQYSEDGTNFTSLGTLIPSAAYQNSSYTLPNTTTHIRFRAGTTTNKWTYIDNITITGTIPQPVSTTTDSSGFYLFDGSNCIESSTNYQIRIDTGQNAVFGLFPTTKNVGDDTLDSDATLIGADAVIATAPPTTGENITHDFGFNDSIIGNYVWLDTNKNGLQDVGESGIEGVEVTLHDAAGDPVMCIDPAVIDTYVDKFELTTDVGRDDGTLIWASIWVHTINSQMMASSTYGNPDGSMRILATTPDHYATREVALSVFSGPITMSFDHQAPSGAPVMDIQYSEDGTNFTSLGTVASAVVYQNISYTLPNTATHIRFRSVSGGNVWTYFDNLVIEGTVDRPVTTTTDSNGLYMFSGSDCVAPSTNYQTHIDTTQVSLAGLLFDRLELTTQDAGDDTLDSDAIMVNENAVISSATSPAAGETTTYDFGFQPTDSATIGDYVWDDSNGNGLQDDGEPGIEGVVVRLQYANGDPVMCVKDPTVIDSYMDEFDTSVASVWNSYGTLDWSTVPWTLSAAAIVSSNGTPGGTGPSDGSLRIYGTPAYYPTRPVDLSVFRGEVTLSFDHFTVFHEINKFAIQYSEDGTNFTTIDTLETTASTVHILNETYRLPNTATHIRIQGISNSGGGHATWFDNITVSGVIAQPVIAITDVNGLYTFDGTDCVDPSTDYKLLIDTTQTVLDGYILTTQNAGSDDTIDSDALMDNTDAVINPATSPVADAEDLSYDFGFIQDLVCIGDLVWLDGDNSGTLDGSEYGLNGITLQLYKDNGDNVFNSSSDTLIDSTTTATLDSVDGAYTFCGDYSGNYFISIPPTEFGIGKLLYDFGSSTADVDPETSSTEDDDNGTDGGDATVNGIVTVAPISLAKGAEPTTDSNVHNGAYQDNSTNMTVDFGVYAIVAMDYGDLPTIYRNTLINDNGARHISDGLYLGTTVTTEDDGQESNASADSDDGVTVPTAEDPAWSGSTASLPVVVSGDGCLNIWIDYGNGGTGESLPDGDFTDPGEWALQNEIVSAATTSVSVGVPAWAFDPSYTLTRNPYLRVRLTPRDADEGCANAEAYATAGAGLAAGTASPYGLATGGEVEDYQMAFVPTSISLQSLTASVVKSPFLLVLVSAMTMLSILSATAVLIKRKDVVVQTASK